MIRRMLLVTAAAALIVVPTHTGAAGASLRGTVSNAKASANLVVYVETAPGAVDPPAKHAVMDQKGMQFVPHVMAIVQGTTVDFKNSDAVVHNVFSPDGEGYNLGTWASGAARSYTFKRLGTYTQLCSIHPEMQAFIVVVPNQYYAVTAANGHFEIDDLPPGHYELKVWGEHLKSKDKKKTFPVDVAASGSTTTLALGS